MRAREIMHLRPAELPEPFRWACCKPSWSENVLCQIWDSRRSGLPHRGRWLDGKEVQEVTEERTAEVDFAVEGLVFLLCGAGTRRGLKAVPQAFDGFEPLYEGEDVSEDPGILVQDHAADVPVWPFQVAFAKAYKDEAEAQRFGQRHGAWQFAALRSVSDREVRGKVARFFPRMVEFRMCAVDPDTSAAAHTVYYGVGKNRLILANHGQSWTPEYHRYYSFWNSAAEFSMRMSGGFALRKRYHWSVLVGLESGPRARLLTDPTGVRELLRLRDKPEGRSRRDALLHWCRGHYRQKRDDADARRWVREHMRGRQECNWDGLRIRIEPSAIDAETAQQPKRIAA